MPEDQKTVSAPQPEANQQPSQNLPSEDDFDSLLGGIPGLSEYFGDHSEKPASTDDAPASAEPATPEAPAVETPQPVEGAEVEEKKEAEAETVPDAVQRRIDKLVAQKHEAVEKAEALATKVTELEAKVQQIAPAIPTADSPLADIESVEVLNERLVIAQRVKLWALEHLDGGEVEDGKGGSYMMPGERVKQLLAQSEGLITQHVPQRRAYLTERTAHESEARTMYPELYKAGTELNQTLNTWVKIFPEVRRFPDYQLIIADALAGQKLRMARKAQKAGNNSRPTPNTLSAPSPASGHRVPQKSILSKNLLDRMASDRSALDAFSESLIGTSKE